MVLPRQLVWTSVICWAICFSVNGETCDDEEIQVCTSQSCGLNSECTINENQAVCSCLPGYEGDPLSCCTKLDCTVNEECRDDQSCDGNRCVNPCMKNTCGRNAICRVKNHLPVCTCDQYYTGIPTYGCVPMDEQDICNQINCGSNTKCEVYNNVPRCQCLPGYKMDPVRGCYDDGECESNSDCNSQEYCHEFKCVMSCSICGKNAICNRVIDHIATCRCVEGYSGDPYTSCQPECTQNSECPSYRPFCRNNKCIDPCTGACGIGAKCQLRYDRTTCTCPEYTTGDPMTRCYPIKRDLCDPHPCGIDAVCKIGYNKSGKECPICSCEQGYVGNPRKYCVKGNCMTNYDCSGNEVCKDNTCTNACTEKCGYGAECNVQYHTAVCTSPERNGGDSPVSPCDGNDSNEKLFQWDQCQSNQD